MSLQVWLPLDGNLKNNGVCDIPLDNNGATVDDNGKIGKCYSFSGSSQYLRIDSKVINTAEYSISFWMYATDVSSNHCIFSTRNVISGAVNIYLLAAGIRFDNGTNWATGFKPTVNTWYHIVCIQDATSQYIYVNGELNNQRTGITTLSQISSVCTIGCEHINGSSIGTYFKGKLNDVRIYDHALSPFEVKDISRGLVRHYKFDDLSYGYIVDSSGYGFNSETNNITTINPDSARYSNCSVFDGSVYAEFPSLPMSSKSVSFWVKTTYTTASSNTVLFADKGSGIAFGYSGSGRFLTSTGVKSKMWDITETGYKANVWNHIVIVKTGNTTRNLYINGVLETPISNTGSWTMNKDAMDVGCRYSSEYSSYYTGHLSDFRAYVTELTQYDVSQLYEIGGKITKNVRLHANEMYELEYTETTSAVADSNIIFIDDALERPVDDLHITFEPKVSGTGEPSEENIMNISGVQNGITLHQHGNNLCDWSYVADNVSLIPVTDSATRYGYIFDLPVGIYVVNAKWATSTRTSSSLYYKVKRADGTYDASHTLCSGTSLSTAIVTINDGDVFRIYGSSTKSSTQTMFRRFLVNITSSDSSRKYGAWNPYKKNLINFAFPTSDNIIYGGTLDVLEGSMSVKWELHTILSVSATDTKYSTYVVGAKGYIDGDLAGNSISNILKCYSSGTAGTMPVGYFKAINSDGYNRAHICICFENCRGSSSTETANLNNAKLSALNQAGTPLQVLVPLATPRTYQFDPKTVYTYAGVNTFYAVGAKVGVTYSVLDSVENSTVQVSKQSVANATGLYINQNLIQSNEIYVVKSTYLAYKLGLVHTLTKNATYTMQLWDIDVSNEGKTESELGVSVYLGGGNSRVLNFIGTTYFTNGHADYLCGTFKWTGTNTNAWLQVYNSSPSVSATMSLSIGKWKLEEGSTPTPYMYDASNPLYSGVNHGFIEGELRDSTVSGKVFKGHYEFEEFEEH